MTYVPVSTMRELRRLHEGSLHIELFGSGGTIVSGVCRLVESHDALSGHRTPSTICAAVEYFHAVRIVCVGLLSAFTRNNQIKRGTAGPHCRHIVGGGARHYPVFQENCCQRRGQ